MNFSLLANYLCSTINGELIPFKRICNVPLYVLENISLKNFLENFFWNTFMYLRRYYTQQFSTIYVL